MSVSFNPGGRLIFVRVVLHGPVSEAVLRLALDTGASRTIISPSRLISVGFALDSAERWVNYSGWTFCAAVN